MSEAALPEGFRGRLGAAALLSDERLTRRAAKGDERAFAAIFERYHQDLYRFCLAIVGNPADAQDALQNTMIKVLRALPGERRRIELKPWLYRIAHNEAVELLRRRRPTEELDPEAIAAGGGLAENAESRERLRRLIADLGQLPERQRGVLVMRELGGLDFEQIGTALDTSPATARQTLYEARQSLRQMDEGREMDCEAVTRALSDADGRVTRRRDIRAHLRACPDCRRFQAEIAGRREDLGALAPLPGVAAVGLLQGLLGGAGGSGGAGAGTGVAGAAAGGAAKSLGAGAAIKSAAAVAAVAVVGVGAADRGGVVDVAPWGGDGSRTQKESGADGTRSGGAPVGSTAPGSNGAGDELGPAAGVGAPAPGVGAPSGAKSGGEGATEARGGDRSAAPPDAGGTHPHGRGHAKQHPEAASPGQQTAASHKATGEDGGNRGGGAAKGTGGRSKGKPAKQAKPPNPSAKPVKPAQPSQPQNASSAAPSDGGAVVAPPKAPSGPGAAQPPSPSPQGEAKSDPHPSESSASLDG